MQQREVQDAGNTTWTCVQALAGGSAATAELAAEKLESDAGTVPVVCTPTGGEQTLRLQLPSDWLEQMSDDALLAAIEKGRKQRRT